MTQLNVKLSNIDLLIESGLGNIKKLPYYRIILTNPQDGVTNMVYRQLTVKLLEKIFPMILNDSVLFNRFRQLLMSQRKIKEDLGEMELSPSKREWGTASLANDYRRDTPGQSGKSLKVIKRIIKDKK